jgi:hypothetical protein
MSKRNIWGEKIKTKRAWLFGLGGDSGVISSPFGMTAFKNTATARFFNSDERENISYRQPSAVAKNINDQDVDLKTLRNSSGQTAYDRWLEIKSELRLTSSGSVSISGKGVSLKDYIENLIADKDSNLYTQPSGVRQGKDLQQMFIMSIIHGVENVAYNVMQQEFPQLIAIQETEIKDLIQDYKNQNQKKTSNAAAAQLYDNYFIGKGSIIAVSFSHRIKTFVLVDSISEWFRFIKDLCSSSLVI